MILEIRAFHKNSMLIMEQMEVDFLPEMILVRLETLIYQMRL